MDINIRGIGYAAMSNAQKIEDPPMIQGDLFYLIFSDNHSN